jgi:hypothetical protein
MGRPPRYCSSTVILEEEQATDGSLHIRRALVPVHTCQRPIKSCKNSILAPHSCLATRPVLLTKSRLQMSSPWSQAHTCNFALYASPDSSWCCSCTG